MHMTKSTLNLQNTILNLLKKRRKLNKEYRPRRPMIYNYN